MNIPKTPKVKTKEELALEQEKRRFQDCYLFIDTNFKRKSEPIFVLAVMDNKRRLPYAKIGNFYFKSDNEILEIVSAFVKEEYFTCDGVVPLWGKIVSYNWHHLDGKVYIFDVDGSYKLSNTQVNESRATLSLK